MTEITISTKALIEALGNVEKPLHPRYIYRLSDIIPEELFELKKAWPGIPTQRRLAILEDIEEIGHQNLTLSFEDFARFAVTDSEPRVRELAVRALWEYESQDLAGIFTTCILNDPDPGVRAAAASGLGEFVYRGELEEIPASKLHNIEDTLLSVLSGNDEEDVRLRALESLGYSSRGEVAAWITDTFASKKKAWKASALFAMGRSADQAWATDILASLDDEDPRVSSEAARAAGELELAKALPGLRQLLEHDDTDVRMAAAWSLSQIGGERVQEALETLLEQTEDDEEAEFLEDALENLSFTEETRLFDLVEIDGAGIEDEDDEFLDLLDEDEEE